MKNKKYRSILILISIIIFISIGYMVRKSTEGIFFDVIIMDYIHSKTSPIGISMMKFVSFLGSAYFLLGIGAIFLVFMTRKRDIRAIKLLILSIAGSYILNATSKIIFQRVRPLEYFLIEQGGYSFPSGHSMVSMSFYTTIGYLLLENLENKKWRRIIWVGNYVIIGLIGFSRLYLGVHWPTDVLLGYLMGYWFYYISRTTVKK